MLDADVVRNPTGATRVRPRIVQVGLSEVQMGVDPDHADVLREGTDDRGREAVLPADHDRTLSRTDDFGGYLGDAANNLRCRSYGGRVDEVSHGDIEQVT